MERRQQTLSNSEHWNRLPPRQHQTQRGVWPESSSWKTTQWGIALGLITGTSLEPCWCKQLTALIAAEESGPDTLGDFHMTSPRLLSCIESPPALKCALWLWESWSTEEFANTSQVRPSVNTSHVDHWHIWLPGVPVCSSVCLRSCFCAHYSTAGEDLSTVSLPPHEASQICKQDKEQTRDLNQRWVEAFATRPVTLLANTRPAAVGWRPFQSARDGCSHYVVSPAQPRGTCYQLQHVVISSQTVTLIQTLFKLDLTVTGV